jgi:putative transposase
VSHKQGVRFELAPTNEQAVLLGRHCGLSRVVENFCLEVVRKKWAQRKAEETYGIPKGQLTDVPWSAPALEKEWRAAHPERFPWFAENTMSSRVPKEACRVRAAGFSNYLKSRKGERKGTRMGFPTWRKRKHGSRFRYDADRAKPRDARTVRLPAIGDVRVREDMSWLTDRIATGKARILGATIREQAGLHNAPWRGRTGNSLAPKTAPTTGPKYAAVSVSSICGWRIDAGTSCTRPPPD